MSNLFTLQGRHVLVTGAAGAIGMEICDLLREKDANVIAADLAGQFPYSKRADTSSCESLGDPFPVPSLTQQLLLLFLWTSSLP